MAEIRVDELRPREVAMKVKFYGTRGSIPVCSPGFQEFGGNTTCILLEGPQRTVVLDAGTGIRELGKELVKDPRLGVERPCFLLFTHFHWDHIQGLPFFMPAYDSRRSFTITAIGRERYGKDIRSIFETQMQRDYFPVPLDAMGARIDFLTSASDCVIEGQAKVCALKHHHPGDAYSFRIDDPDGRSLVFCTDVEHGDRVDEGIVALARGADLLIHEGQYTPEELSAHRGWGHSTWEQAVEVAERAGVKRLVVTHHDPDHDDVFLRDIERKVQARLPTAVLAREGMELEV
jgi:phosphoribosyl 1,2-cyclic phosphodiesterase